MELDVDDSFLDDSFKRPGAVPFKWEIQPGVPKPHGHIHCSSPFSSAVGAAAAAAQPKLHPPPSQSPARFVRSTSASPSKRRGSHTKSTSPFSFPSSAAASPSPSRKLRSPAAVVSQGCFFPVSPLKSPLKRRNDRKEGDSPEAPWPRRAASRRSSATFSPPYGRRNPAEEEAVLAARWLF